MSEKYEFLNRVRSLFNIDGYLLPELTKEQQLEFVRNPVRYFMSTDDEQQSAIWREIEKRQNRTAAGGSRQVLSGCAVRAAIQAEQP